MESPLLRGLGGGRRGRGVWGWKGGEKEGMTYDVNREGRGKYRKGSRKMEGVGDVNGPVMYRIDAGSIQTCPPTTTRTENVLLMTAERMTVAFVDSDVCFYF